MEPWSQQDSIAEKKHYYSLDCLTLPCLECHDISLDAPTITHVKKVVIIDIRGAKTVKSLI